MAKCDGCGGFVKRSKLISTLADGMQRFFCCKGCEELFWRKQEIIYGNHEGLIQ